MAADLRQRQSGDEVEPERSSKVSPGDLVWLDDELSTPKHARRGRDERRAEPEEDVRGVEEVEQRPDHEERERQRVLELDAHVLLRARQVQEQRVHEQRQEAGGQEDLVPQVDEVPARVEEDLAAPAGGVHQGLELLREGARQHTVLEAPVPAAGLVQAPAAETQPAFPWVVMSLAAVLPAQVLQWACSKVMDVDVILKSEKFSQRRNMVFSMNTDTAETYVQTFRNVAFFQVSEIMGI